nr:hypothetical protein [Tanacetum cinerariifolium]
MSLSLAENVIVAGADNRPPMLDKTHYSSWASHMLLYIKGKENGKLHVDSVLNRPFKYDTIIVPGTSSTPATIRDRIYDEFTDAGNLRESCDIKATNIVLQGLLQDIYNLVNHHTKAKVIWDRVKLLIEGSEISLQERESKLYDEFDMFTSVHGETIDTYHLSTIWAWSIEFGLRIIKGGVKSLWKLSREDLRSGESFGVWKALLVDDLEMLTIGLSTEQNDIL